ncbi:MAG: vWA domain-containing protein, partial [Pyrinomonadaceae bacterium]
LITDGDDATSSSKIETVLAAAKETNVRIIVVGMSDEKINTKLLDRLAKGTGGSAFYPRTPKETESIVDNLASALRGK